MDACMFLTRARSKGAKHALLRYYDYHSVPLIRSTCYLQVPDAAFLVRADRRAGSSYVLIIGILRRASNRREINYL